MPTINERLAALEAAVLGISAGGDITAGGSSDTIYLASREDASQNVRLASLESTTSALAASVSSLDARISGLENDYATQTDLDALEARVEVLEAKPGGSVAWVRNIATSVGAVGAENITTALTMGTATTYAEAILAHDPVAYFRLGEASGTAFADASTTGNTAYGVTPTGSLTLGQTGAIAGDDDTCVLYDANAYIYAPSTSAYNLGNGPLSIAFWVKLSAAGVGEQKLVDRVNGFAQVIKAATSDYVQFNSANTGTLATSTVALDTDWHFVVCTKSGTTSKIYIDGADVTSAGTDYTLSGTTGDLVIGANRGKASDFFEGWLDEVALFDKALSLYEVQQLYGGTGGGGGGGGTGSVTVSSVADLLYYLADTTVTEIIVEDGTYAIAAAGNAGSLYIDNRFAGRPYSQWVTVRAETPGGVTFSRSNGNGCWLRFLGGACYQTWSGFKFGSGHPYETGVIVFGGSTGVAAPHDITIEDCELLDTVVESTAINDHGVYFSLAAAPGPYNITIDGLVSNAQVYDGIVFYHSSTGNPNANNVTMRNLDITGATNGIQFWDTTIYSIYIEDSTIDASEAYGVYHHSGSGITLDTVTTTSSGYTGFYSDIGGTGVTQINCSFDP